jgi:hypothetical protein
MNEERTGMCLRQLEHIHGPYGHNIFKFCTRTKKLSNQNEVWQNIQQVRSKSNDWKAK